MVYSWYQNLRSVARLLPGLYTYALRASFTSLTVHAWPLGRAQSAQGLSV